MKIRTRWVLAATALLTLTAGTLAGTGGGYTITDTSASNGGGAATGGGYEAVISAGQTNDGGVSEGGGYTLAGGVHGEPGEPSTPPCTNDLDGNNSVDVLDLLAILGAWGPCDPPCAPDLDADGVVGVLDLLMILAAWGPCP